MHASPKFIAYDFLEFQCFKLEENIDKFSLSDKTLRLIYLFRYHSHFHFTLNVLFISDQVMEKDGAVLNA